METFFSTLINGLSLGGIYAMIALGYTMVYGIAKMLNFAHGDIIMVGGYTIFLFLFINPIVAIAAAIVFCVVIGILIEKLAYKPLRGSSPLAVLITAIGVSYLLQSFAQILFGSATKFVEIATFEKKLQLGAVSIDIPTIITLVCSAAVMAALSIFVKYSKTGRAMIAVSEDKGAAQLMGINVNTIIMITFAIGSALCCACGSFHTAQITCDNTNIRRDAGYQGFHGSGHRRDRIYSRRNGRRTAARYNRDVFKRGTGAFPHIPTPLSFLYSS